jgi:hypothetical protein
LDDDFRSDKAGTSPTRDDLNPAGKAWLIQEGDADRVQVLNDDPVGSRRPGAGRYLKIERREETHLGGGLAWIKLLPQDAAETQDGLVEVEARVYVPSQNRGPVQIDAYDNVPPWGCDRRAFHLRLMPNGTVSYYRQQHVAIPSLRIKTDAWQNVSIRAHMQEAVFDVTIEGKTAENIPFADDRIHRLMTVCLGPNMNNATLCVERVKVSVTP